MWESDTPPVTEGLRSAPLFQVRARNDLELDPPIRSITRIVGAGTDDVLAEAQAGRARFGLHVSRKHQAHSLRPLKGDPIVDGLGARAAAVPDDVQAAA